jgi:MFS family permease
LRKSIAEGSAFNLMVGLGETYFPAFVLTVGLGQVAAGLISTVPLTAGALLQLFSPVMVGLTRSYRKWVLVCATLQAACFLPFIVGAWHGSLSLPLAFGVASLYWAFGMGAGPAWNSWMGTLVPCRLQTAFFTRRSLWTQVTALCGFLGGGLALRFWPPGPGRAGVFAGLFAGALICRALSIRWLHQQTEPVPPSGEATRPIFPIEFWRRLRGQKNLRNVFHYLLLVQFFTQVASPFYTPFMLGELHFTYADYVLLIAASYAIKVLCIPSLGRLARRQGSRSLIWVGGTGIILLPALWLLSVNFYFLLVVQLLSGFFWAAFDLAALLLLLELIPTADRTPLLSTYNFVNALVIIAGSLSGGAILHFFGNVTEAYILVFSVSAVGRAVTLLWLRSVSSHRTEWIPLVLRPIALRPSFGFQGQPVQRPTPRQTPPAARSAADTAPHEKPIPTAVPSP